MNRIARISIGAIFALSCLIAGAQPNYTIIGGTGCGPAESTLSCTFDVNQINGLGEYAYVTLSADLANNLDNQGRGIEFGNFVGPAGKNLLVATYQADSNKMYRIYTTSASVTSNGQTSTQVTVFSAYIEGEYVDGTKFTGLITIHFAYTAQFQQGGTYIWERSLAKGAGAVTIEGQNASVLKAHPEANDPCFGGQVISGAYPATGWRLLVADWWFGEGCWVGGQVKWVIYDYPIV
jgi:hypothetical protein